MNNTERRDRIVEYLRIKPISHGQIYTFQIAIPESESVEIPLERHEQLKSTLTQQGSNLIPLIVRRTEAYTEEEEYEIVHGADWCRVAQELDVEKLWVWVFDLTDEQAVVAKQEMQQLIGYSSESENTGKEETDIGILLEQKLKPIYAKINQLFYNPSSKAEKSDYDEKLRVIESKLENLSSAFQTLTDLIKEVLPPPKLNLTTASEQEVKRALEEVKVKNDQKNAAWEAIKYWKQPGKILSWQNIKKSTESGKEHKVKNFAKGTYDKLKEVANIHSN